MAVSGTILRGNFAKPTWIPKHLRKDLTFWAPLKSVTDGFGAGASVAATYARASVASYMDSTGIVKVGSGVARYLTNGLLMEGARTNIYLRSEEFDNAYWTKTNCSISADADTAPDGTATADRMIAAAGSSAKYLQRAITGTASGTNAISIFAKAGGVQWVGLGISGATNDLIHFFDLTNGVVGTASEVGGAYSSTATIEAVNGYAGWYRCKVVITTTADTPTIGFVMISNADATRTWTGDGTSYVSIWGVQYESGAGFASTYIPTTSATVTRNQDTLTYPYSGNGPSTGPGTAMLWASTYQITTAQTFLDTRDGSNTQGITMSVQADSDPEADMFTATSQAPLAPTTDDFVADTRKHMAFAWDTNDCELFTDGVSRATDTTATLPSSHTIINVGADGAAGVPLYGTVSNLMIFDRRLYQNEVLSLAKVF